MNLSHFCFPTILYFEMYVIYVLRLAVYVYLCCPQLKVLKDSHVYSIAERHSLESFVISDSDITLTIHIVWGMLPNDMSECGMENENAFITVCIIFL